MTLRLHHIGYIRHPNYKLYPLMEKDNALPLLTIAWSFLDEFLVVSSVVVEGLEEARH
jgi:hypothetical protein